MQLKKPIERLTLRELLIAAQKSVREVADHQETDTQRHVKDLRDLTRPVRRKSRFPALLALRNALRRLESSYAETCRLADELVTEMQRIHEIARKEDSQVISA